MLDDLFKIHSGETVTTKMLKKPLNRRTLFSVIGAAVLVFAVAGAGLIASRPGAPSVGNEIPNVVGLTEPAARALLTEYVVTITRAHDSRIPKDRVASQIPLATSRAKSGSGVVLTISDGPGDSVVPTDLVGLSLQDARASLTAAGLVVSLTEAIPSDAVQGTVLKVTPEPGSTITAGSGVVLQIASGEVEVPNLIGIDGIQAKTLLVQAGFLINELEANDPSQPAGVVIRQAPDGGTTQTIGKSVTITINKTP